MHIIDIPTQQSRTFPDQQGYWSSEHTLALANGYRFGLGGWDRNGKGRLVQNGPLVAGPHAYAYGLAVAITADPRMSTAYEREQDQKAGREHLVADCDFIRFGDDAFKVRVVRREWIELDYVGSYVFAPEVKA